MTAEQIVEALCEAQGWAEWFEDMGPSQELVAARNRRDRIKAALVAALEGALTYRCEPPCKQTDEYGECQPCREWRKLEEACRGD